ncbi:MAG: response regulator [Magnetococcus sp. YQC-5]
MSKQLIWILSQNVKLRSHVEALVSRCMNNSVIKIFNASLDALPEDQTGPYPDIMIVELNINPLLYPVNCKNLVMLQTDYVSSKIVVIVDDTPFCEIFIPFFKFYGIEKSYLKILGYFFSWMQILNINYLSGSISECDDLNFVDNKDRVKREEKMIYTLWIVDDEEQIITGIHDNISFCGKREDIQFRVVPINGKDALIRNVSSAIENQKELPDLVIMDDDIKSNKEGFTEYVPYVRSLLDFKIPILALTGKGRRDDNEARERALNSGASEFVHKGELYKERDYLYKIIRKLLGVQR